jgi:hypothetical protein
VYVLGTIRKIRVTVFLSEAFNTAA